MKNSTLPALFHELTVPFARGFFLGDYEAPQPAGAGFQALFIKTNCNALDATGQTFPSVDSALRRATTSYPATTPGQPISLPHG